MRAVRLWRPAIACVAALVLSGCGGANQANPVTVTVTTEATTTEATTTDEASGGPDRELFESNVKYEALDGIIARGAVAPFIANFSCRWRSDTVADCTGTGYDNAADQSECGYALLPCGDFDLTVHAECADGSGHDCQVEMDLVRHG
jgi:hypothetical protein